MLAIVAGSVAVAASTLADVQAPTGARRRVHITATTSTGMHVANLTPADLTVKEGGKERAILQLEPSIERLKICLAIDEALSPDDVIRGTPRDPSTFTDAQALAN